MAQEAHCVADVQATLGEGPVWVAAEQALYWVDIKGRKIFRLGQDGQRNEWPTPIPRRVDRSARQRADSLAARTRGSPPSTWQPGASTSSPIPSTTGRRTASTMAKSTAPGGFGPARWTIPKRQASGALYRVDADRTIARLDDDYRITNGPAFSPDGRTMYHNDTGRKRTYAFDLSEDGAASNRRLFLRNDRSGGHPDGMTVDSEGCLWIAFWDGWCIRRFSPSGRCLRTIRLPVEQPSSCAFGGPALDRLYVTSARSRCQTSNFTCNLPLAGCLCWKRV